MCCARWCASPTGWLRSWTSARWPPGRIGGWMPTWGGCGVKCRRCSGRPSRSSPRGKWSRIWLWPCRPPCWCDSRRPPWPMPSAPPGWPATAAGCTAPCRPGWTRRRSSTARCRREHGCRSRHPRAAAGGRARADRDRRVRLGLGGGHRRTDGRRRGHPLPPFRLQGGAVHRGVPGRVRGRGAGDAGRGGRGRARRGGPTGGGARHVRAPGPPEPLAGLGAPGRAGRSAGRRRAPGVSAAVFRVGGARAPGGDPGRRDPGAGRGVHRGGPGRRLWRGAGRSALLGRRGRGGAQRHPDLRAPGRRSRGVSSAVRIERDGPVFTVLLSRPERRNAVDGATAAELADAFREFDADPSASVAVLHGEGGVFCAGADLVEAGGPGGNRVAPDGDGPMGPTRLKLGKPVIAAVAGHAVAGGLELALWCDLRVAEESAVFGVFCRRWGVPLIDGGTVRLPRLIGQSRALDMILTGRPVSAPEALEMGLVNRLVADGESRPAAEDLARELAAFPQTCLREDRLSLLEQWGLSEKQAMASELEHGLRSLREVQEGVERFRAGAGRHGAFE